MNVKLPYQDNNTLARGQLLDQSAINLLNIFVSQEFICEFLNYVIIIRFCFGDATCNSQSSLHDVKSFRTTITLLLVTRTHYQTHGTTIVKES